MAAVAVVVSLGVAPFGAQAAFNLDNWDVLLTYTMNSDGTIQDFTQDGTYDKVVECLGSWSLAEDTTGSAANDDWTIQYAWDFVSGELGILETKDGEKTRKILDCDLFNLPSTDLTQDWVVVGACNDGTTFFDKPAQVDIEVVELAPEDFDHSSTLGVEATNFDCVAAQAAAPGNENHPEPYSGRVTAQYEDESGNVIASVEMDVVGGVLVPGTWHPTHGDGDCTDSGCFWEAHARESILGQAKIAAGTWGAFLN